jgi:hypothetical protein
MCRKTMAELLLDQKKVVFLCVFFYDGVGTCFMLYRANSMTDESESWLWPNPSIIIVSA